MKVWFDPDELEELTKTGDIKTVPVPLGLEPVRRTFAKRETPGRRMFNTPRLVPVLFLSRRGKNRRKKNKRKDRKSSIMRLTDLV